MLMISLESAFRIACEKSARDGYGPIVGASKAVDGWVFDVEQKFNADGFLEPGGPSPIFVSASGEAREVFLPSNEGFAILDSIVEEGIPLP